MANVKITIVAATLCLLPCVLIPLVASTSIGAIVYMSTEFLTLGFTALIVAVIIFLAPRPGRNNSQCRANKCSCASYCELPNNTAPPDNSPYATQPKSEGVVEFSPEECELPAEEVPSRLNVLRNLIVSKLLYSRQEAETLILTFTTDVENQIREIALAESQCCHHLNFVVNLDQNSLHLEINGSESSIDELRKMLAL